MEEILKKYCWVQKKNGSVIYRFRARRQVIAEFYLNYNGEVVCTSSHFSFKDPKKLEMFIFSISDLTEYK